MKGIDSLIVLENEIKTNELVWLLLYKSGSEQSNCAFSNYEKSAESAGKKVLLYADVNNVIDIHPKFNITSVPTLLQFRKGELTNLIKGCHNPDQFKAIFENTVYISESRGKEASAKSVIVYTTPTCSWCTTLKRHLEENKIRYREIDVTKDQKAAEDMVRRSGQQGVPQTNINGQMIVGFDKNRINNLLGIN